MSTTIENQQEIFEAFKRYPWHEDKVFQNGLQSILNNMPKVNSEENQEAELLEDLRLLKAKHFYFTRFQQNFDLESFLEYETEKLESGSSNEELFQRMEDYDYDNDINYTKGLPNIIHGWLEEQSKGGLWSKDKLDMEFSKAKACYYNSRIEKVNLVAYFTWKAKKEEANQPVCPFANLWQNKTKVGPVDQINGISFVMAEKPLGTGAETLTFSSPKSQNVLSVDRLKELRNNIQEAENDTQVTSLLITATVADTGDPFDFSERIETKDTKTISSGLAFIDTCSMASDISIRQHSLNHLANTYYDTILYNITQRKKLAVTFSNGQIPLDAVYLFLGLGFIRVLTEHSLLQFHLSLSHAPIPPLLLLAMARMRKPLPAGLELYLALGAPAHGKLRGPELLQLGLADIFVPEAKLSDAFEMAKRMAVCPGPDTPAAVQLALAIQHTYAGPNRLSVWEEYITKVFGNVESLEDIEQRLKNTDNAWSKTILDHWHTLPPALLRAVFKAVNAINTATSPTELLNLEQNLNAKWRQTDDYRAWVSSSNEWVHDKEQVDALVDFYFDGGDSKASSEKLVVYEAPQDTEDEPVVCPVTGQKSSSGAGVCPVGGASSKTISVCPVTGRRSEDTQEANICPATGQCAANTEANNEDNKCPVANMNKDKAMCPVTGQKSEDNKQLLETEGCPFSKLQLSSTTQDTVCPVSGMKSLLSDQ